MQSNLTLYPFAARSAAAVETDGLRYEDPSFRCVVQHWFDLDGSFFSHATGLIRFQFRSVAGGRPETSTLLSARFASLSPR